MPLAARATAVSLVETARAYLRKKVAEIPGSPNK